MAFKAIFNKPQIARSQACARGMPLSVLTDNLAACLGSADIEGQNAV